MNEATTRAWWAHRQGLDGRLQGRPAAEVLEMSGWARSLGGGGPYVGFFARCGAGREAVDAAVERLEIHELPSARGCTYVVPAGDFALALAVGEGFGAEAEMKVARKLGVTDAEIERLCVAILDALERAPLEPAELREAVGGAARSLGEAGKKKGLSTTLPLALGALQEKGEIRRLSLTGRFDSQRYRYALWRPSPLQQGARRSPEERFADLARRFWSWAGPARLAEFQAFAGIGVKAARAAIEPLALQPPPGAVAGDDRLLLPRHAAEIAAFELPKAPCYALVSGLDCALLLRQNMQSLLDEADWERPVATEKGGPVAAGTLTGLPCHAILDRGRLIGLWDYDPEAAEVVWTLFGGAKAPEALRAAVHATQTMIQDQLGDLRFFSLDSPKSRQPRLAALRAAAAAGKS